MDDLPETEPAPYAHALSDLPLQIYWLMSVAAANPFASNLISDVGYDALKAGLRKVRANTNPLKWRERSYLRQQAEDFDRVSKDYARAAVIARFEQLGFPSPRPRDLRIRSWTNVAQGPWTVELRALITYNRDPSLEVEVRINPIRVQTQGAQVSIRQIL